MRLLIFATVVLILFACARSPAPSPSATAPSQTPASPPQSEIINLKPEISVGWAYEAYPSTSADQMLAEMKRMRAAGLNAIWIGHNNPGEVDVNKAEPGLSFAVWYAITHESGERAVEARAMADAVKRALISARDARLEVVLPIGYQIAMGDTWNGQHPDSLRRTFDGQVLQIYSSPPTASPYDATYRSDIAEYYHWIETEWVAPFRDTIQILSLADEPQGGDYSRAAREEFVRRYGRPMEALGPGEVWKLGEFESGVIADFASWSANVWREIDPAMRTTISFHSGDARTRPGLPDIERLFAQTPDNFLITFDTYLHDDLPNKPASPAESDQLDLFLGTLGHLSRAYQKPLLLWGGANSWGLAQQSDNPLGIPDAATNLRLLYDLPTRAGGDVRGVFAWNYNLRGQGLYNAQEPTTYRAPSLQSAVETTLNSIVRQPRPKVEPLEAVVITSARELQAAIGSARSADVPNPLFDTEAIATALHGHLSAMVAPGQNLDEMKSANIFICPVLREYLTDELLTFLKARASEGKIVVVRAETARAMDAPYQSWAAGWAALPESGGIVYSVAEGD